MNVLVTGGSGFIGSNFIRALLMARPGWSVVNIDSLTYAGNRHNLAEVDNSPRYRFEHADINDAPRVTELVAASDAVVHFAAETHVDRSITNAQPFIETNINGTRCLLDAAQAAWAGRHETRFVYISSDEVYGELPLDQPGLRFDELSPLAPNSPYSASKAGADLLAMAYRRTHGLNVLIARCSNNFGPYQHPEKLIPHFVTNLLAGKKVPLYGDGRNVRDWIHVDDCCDAVLAVLERGKPGEIYNVGAGNERSNLELTRFLLAELGLDERAIQFVADRPGHDLRYALDTTKIGRALGWRATRSAWPDALKETIQWYQEHSTWVNTVSSS